MQLLSISEGDVFGESLNGSKPEQFTEYFSINQSRVLNISNCIPSQVDIAEWDVEIALEISFFFDNQNLEGRNALRTLN